MIEELEDGEHVYDCPDCGSEIVYNREKGMLQCSGCGVLKVVGVLEKVATYKGERIEKPDVLMTAKRNEEEYLLEDLSGLGQFESSGFRDVIIGKVENKESFLDELNSGIFPSLSRVVPVDRTVRCSEENFEERLADAVRPYAERIENGDSFKVSFTRRGLSDKVSSREVERKLGSVVWRELEKQGREPEVDLEDPDKIVVIESLGKLFLVGFLSRETLEKYYAIDFL
ncbi:hypothetical protein AKJ47_02550 [candidate division MSBL1 archaeon SCGC-AAA261G05]|uniref:THUMP domain-containing protein n=1 Tax=candidate division MSBL1 archaeon SCGC-AAA261G05 TaxID=1698276 RepID=A0A133VA21_9EURY|nr:hypothetical protein AKJ47_02550 [candidate division MSBL1 archaeon SCGC-AAA261G05]